MPPKYLRRSISLPTVLGILAVLVLGFPVWLVLAWVVETFLAPRRRPLSRALVFLVRYGWLELRVLLRGAWIWTVHARLGRRIDTPPIQERLQELINIYGHGIYAASSTFGLDIQATGLDVLDDGAPVLCFGHHASILDSVLPVEVLGHRAGYGLRYVIKSTLAWGPAFDIVGHWAPVHHVDRSGRDTERERERVAELAKDLHGRQAAVIFPEGTFYTAKRLARAVERIREQAPDLVERAEALRHVLPPKPAGALALLEAAPHADVVFVAHVGFEKFVNMARIAANVPFREPIRLHLWRVPRHEIPTDPDGQFRWLFGQHERMDAWVTAQLEPIDDVTPLAS